MVKSAKWLERHGPIENKEYLALNLALITDGIPPYVMGGMQKHSRLLAEFAAKQGIDVYLYHCFPPGSAISDQAVVQSFPTECRPHIIPRGVPYKDDGIIPGHYLRSQKKLSNAYAQMLLQEPFTFDYIYTKGFVGIALLSKGVRSKLNAPIGVKFHGMNMFQSQPDWKGELSKHMLRGAVDDIMHKSDHVFSYGGKITEIIASRGVDSKKIIEIPSGIGQSWIAPSIKACGKLRRLLFIGRYDRVKGLPELYKALDNNTAGNWSLTLVGPIPREHHKNDDRLRYHGSVGSAGEMKDIIDQHDVLICPSISEGMPNVILEAMARGLGVIATDVGATAAMIDGNGWLVEQKNISALEQAIDECLNMPDHTLQELKQRSKEIIQQRFTWEAIIERFVQFLKHQSRSN